MDLERFEKFISDIDNIEIFKNFVESKWLHQLQNNFKPVLKRRPRRRFNPMTVMTEQQFKAKYRFTKNSMRRIIEMVRDDLVADHIPTKIRSNQVPVDLQVMTAIRYWGLSEHPEVTMLAHGISHLTLTKICKRVAVPLALKASRYIRMPVTLAEKERETNAFLCLSGMPQVIGAVAHFSLRIRNNKSKNNNENIIDVNKPKMLIQIVSDSSLKIRDLECRLSELDGTNEAFKMFAHTRIKERFEQNEFRGRVLLGDNRLSYTPYLFIPLICPKAPEEHEFNRAHASAHSPATNCLNTLKKRFGILGSEIESSSVAKHTIIALALLHNMAVEWNDSVLDIDTLK